MSSSDAFGSIFGCFVAFAMLSIASCKWPNSCIISNSSLTTGCSRLTNVQNRVRSSIMAARNDRRSTSSKSALRCEISCIDDSTKLCMESDWPFLAFFCSRSVSVERFFSSDRHRLYSLACSLSMTLACRFQSSTLSCRFCGNIHCVSEFVLVLGWWYFKANLPVKELSSSPSTRSQSFSFVSQPLYVADILASKLCRSPSMRLYCAD